MILLPLFTFTSVVQADTAAAIGHGSQPVTPRIDSAPVSRLDLLSDFPAEFGTIKSKFQGGDQFVVHIQDAHINEDAQKNIAKLIKYFEDKHSLGLVSVEGAWGDINTRQFQFVKNKEVRTAVADFFLRQGRLSGTEYAVIADHIQSAVYGVEDETLYYQNKQAYLDALNLKAKGEEVLVQLHKVLNDVSRFIFSTEVRDLNAKRLVFQQSGHDLVAYVRALQAMAEKNEINIAEYPGMQSLVELTELENQINFDKAEKETDALIRGIKKLLPGEMLTEFLTKTVHYRMKKMRRGQFYGYLLGLARTVLPRDKQESSANALSYLRYIQVYENIDSGLFEEISRLDGSVRDAEFSTDDQKSLDRLWRIYDISSKLFDFTLTKDDAQFYFDHRAEFSSQTFKAYLEPKLKEYHFSYGLPSLEVLDRDLPRLEKFYDFAIKRDSVLIENALAKAKSGKHALSAIVTGGFHTPGIERHLQDQGISYLVVTPKITKAIDQAKDAKLYEDALKGVPLKIEKQIDQAMAAHKKAALNDPRFQLAAMLALLKASPDFEVLLDVLSLANAAGAVAPMVGTKVENGELKLDGQPFALVEAEDGFKIYAVHDESGKVLPLFVAEKDGVQIVYQLTPNLEGEGAKSAVETLSLPRGDKKYSFVRAQLPEGTKLVAISRSESRVERQQKEAPITQRGGVETQKRQVSAQEKVEAMKALSLLLSDGEEAAFAELRDEIVFTRDSKRIAFLRDWMDYLNYDKGVRVLELRDSLDALVADGQLNKNGEGDSAVYSLKTEATVSAEPVMPESEDARNQLIEGRFAALLTENTARFVGAADLQGDGVTLAEADQYLSAMSEEVRATLVQDGSNQRYRLRSPADVSDQQIIDVITDVLEKNKGRATRETIEDELDRKFPILHSLFPAAAPDAVLSVHARLGLIFGVSILNGTKLTPEIERARRYFEVEGQNNDPLGKKAVISIRQTHDFLADVANRFVASQSRNTTVFDEAALRDVFIKTLSDSIVLPGEIVGKKINAGDLYDALNYFSQADNGKAQKFEVKLDENGKIIGVTILGAAIQEIEQLAAAERVRREAKEREAKEKIRVLSENVGAVDALFDQIVANAENIESVIQFLNQLKLKTQNAMNWNQDVILDLGSDQKVDMTVFLESSKKGKIPTSQGIITFADKVLAILQPNNAPISASDLLKRIEDIKSIDDSTAESMRKVAERLILQDLTAPKQEVPTNNFSSNNGSRLMRWARIGIGFAASLSFGGAVSVGFLGVLKVAAGIIGLAALPAPALALLTGVLAMALFYLFAGNWIDTLFLNAKALTYDRKRYKEQASKIILEGKSLADVYIPAPTFSSSKEILIAYLIQNGVTLDEVKAQYQQSGVSIENWTDLSQAALYKHANSLDKAGEEKFRIAYTELGSHTDTLTGFITRAMRVQQDLGKKGSLWKAVGTGMSGWMKHNWAKLTKNGPVLAVLFLVPFIAFGAINALWHLSKMFLLDFFIPRFLWRYSDRSSLINKLNEKRAEENKNKAPHQQKPPFNLALNPTELKAVVGYTLRASDTQSAPLKAAVFFIPRLLKAVLWDDSVVARGFWAFFDRRGTMYLFSGLSGFITKIVSHELQKLGVFSGISGIFGA
ncbi:MAG TPA: hypothetical protein DIS66_07505, partial [Candidatus Omnitrophica bacterium]|nr:hypothetical protein [Candidatus Omnitrophota bacterium]